MSPDQVVEMLKAAGPSIIYASIGITFAYGVAKLLFTYIWKLFVIAAAFVVIYVFMQVSALVNTIHTGVPNATVTYNQNLH